MNQLLRSDGPADPNGPTMGFVLLMAAMCSQVGHWMPAIVNSMIVSLALALIARGFDSAAFIKARQFVVTGTAAIAIMLFWTMQHVACEEIARCNCTASVSFVLPDSALPA